MPANAATQALVIISRAVLAHLTACAMVLLVASMFALKGARALALASRTRTAVAAMSVLSELAAMVTAATVSRCLVSMLVRTWPAREECFGIRNASRPLWCCTTMASTVPRRRRK